MTTIKDWDLSTRDYCALAGERGGNSSMVFRGRDRSDRRTPTPLSLRGGVSEVPPTL